MGTRKAALAALAVASVALSALMLAVVSGPSAGADQAVIPQMLIDPEEHQALRQRVLAMVSPGERAAVADGEVTESELLAAARSAQRCVRGAATSLVAGGAAFESTGPSLSVDGFEVRFTVGVRAPDGGSVPPVDLSDTIRRCQAEHFDHLQLLYQLDRLADRDFVVATGDAFVGCLRAGGVAVPSDVERARAAVADLVFGGQPSETVVGCLGRFPSVTFAAAASVASQEQADAALRDAG